MLLIQDEQVVVDPTRAWWTSVLAGPADLSESAADAPITLPPDIDDQVAHRPAADQAITGTPPSWADPSGTPVYTVIGTFESESRAQIAANYLASFEQIRSSALWVLAPRMIDYDADGEATQSPDVYWDDPYWEPVRSALSANQAVLILIVDEAGTSRAQAILAEDTGSLHTAVLPRPPRYVAFAPPVPQSIGILSAVPALE
ncbi:MAG TPA: hypothetical protein VKT80_04080 [Chloroflexota bacterium]|nr:hypothetical protein [Chloroflexota bacterium]